MRSSSREAIERALIHHNIHYGPPGGGRSTWIIDGHEMTTPQATAYCWGLADKERALERAVKQTPTDISGITEEENETFQKITSGNYANIALVKTILDGEETVAIASVNYEEGEVVVTPLYVAITDAIFKRLIDPMSIVAPSVIVHPKSDGS